MTRNGDKHGHSAWSRKPCWYDYAAFILMILAVAAVLIYLEAIA